MFPLTLTLTLHNVAQLEQLRDLLANAPAPKAGVTASVTAEEKAAVLGNAPPAPSAAPTAPSPRTAEAAPAPASAAPAPKAEKPAAPPTEPPAAAPSAPSPAPADAKPFEYATLQKAVNVALPKHGKDALLAIAKAHGGATFKDLKPEVWAAAHADVVALGV